MARLAGWWYGFLVVSFPHVVRIRVTARFMTGWRRSAGRLLHLHGYWPARGLGKDSSEGGGSGDKFQ